MKCDFLNPEDAATCDLRIYGNIHNETVIVRKTD